MVDQFLIKLLSGGDTGVQHLGDVFDFLFVLFVARGVLRKGNTLVGTIAFIFLRAYGDVNLALSLATGSSPAKSFGDLDRSLQLVFAALVYAKFIDGHIPRKIGKYFGYVESLAFAIVKSSNALKGYNALGGGLLAGIFGAYVAVNGARLIESGVSAINRVDKEALLGQIAGLFFFAFNAYVNPNVELATAVLALWFFSNNWINWRSKFDFSAAVASMKKRK